MTSPFSYAADILDPPAARYARDPLKWIADFTDFVPTDYQAEVFQALASPVGSSAPTRVAVRGPHGLGKTGLAAIATLWFACTRDALGIDWKVPTTASAWRQLTHYLWPEIHKWARTLRRGAHPLITGTGLPTRFLTTLQLRLPHGEAFAAASNQPGRLEGAHATAIMFVFDEAKIIPAPTFDACEGALSTHGVTPIHEARALAISTPGDPNGRFFEIHTRKRGLEDWFPIHVTLDQAIKAGRIAPSWAKQRQLQWGATSQIYLNRVMGEFASADEDSVIPLRFVELAQDRYPYDEVAEEILTELPLDRVACDVARSGGDLTVITRRHKDVILPLERLPQGTDTWITTQRLMGLMRAHVKADCHIDIIGVGAGVYDNIRHDAALRKRARAFNAAKAPPAGYKDVSGELGFANMRSAAWWFVRETLDPESKRFKPVALPPDDDLIGDLTAPRWSAVRRGVIQVEPKDDIKKRLGHSPDAGDSVVMALFSPPRSVNIAAAPSPDALAMTNQWRA